MITNNCSLARLLCKNTVIKSGLKLKYDVRTKYHSGCAVTIGASVLKYQTSRASFYGGFESVANISDYSLSPGVWQSFVTIRLCNHLMKIISTYVDNTKKSEIS